MKKNLFEKVESFRVKKPKGPFYWIIAKLCKPVFCKPYNIKMNFIDDPRKENTNYVLLSNHQTATDFGTFLPYFLPDRFNIVAAYSEFFRKYQHTLFKMGHVIPKKRNYPDIKAIQSMIQIVKKEKGNLLMFPEGVTTLNGANQPVGEGTGKFLKLLKVPVYVVVIENNTLQFPKYDETKRKTKAINNVMVKRLFSIEELENKTSEEIEDLVNETLYVDAYENNLKNQYEYKCKKGHHIAKNITDMLYQCPKCKSEFTNIEKDNLIECSYCHNKVRVDNKYNLITEGIDSITPKTIKRWHDFERILINEKIKNDPDFKYEVKVKLGTLDPFHILDRMNNTSLFLGEGILSLSKNGITYKGKKNKKDFEVTMSTNEVPTMVMCYDCNILHMFYKNELYEFRFFQKGEAVKTQLVVEELHRVNGGKWQNFKFFKYDIKDCFEEEI